MNDNIGAPAPPRWIMDLTAPEPGIGPVISQMLREEVASHGPAAFMVASPYATPSGAELDDYVATPGFRQWIELDDGNLLTTPEMRYLMVGMIGTHNIASVSGGVVVQTRDGFDLPMPSGHYRVRVENDYGADALVVSRIHVVDGVERVEGSVSAYCDNVGELVYRAGCYVNWDATEWMDVSLA